MNLTTPFEVLKYSPAGFDYPTASFCRLIPQYEQELRSECLGKELFDFLVEHLNPYPETFTEWDAEETYAIDDVVVRNNCTFISTANANTTDPLDAGSSWDAFERFDHAGANELWEMYLRQIMASRVYLGSITPATYRSGAGGAVINAGDSSGFRSVNQTEMLVLMREQKAFIELTTQNMIEWLNDNYVAKELPLPGCANNCDVPANRSRRWALR